MYSCAILTMDELRRIIDSFAVACGSSASFPTKCDIVERAKDGIFSLHVMVHVSPQQRQLLSSLPLEATLSENP
jgi:hypothetical protein